MLLVGIDWAEVERGLPARPVRGRAAPAARPRRGHERAWYAAERRAHQQPEHEGQRRDAERLLEHARHQRVPFNRLDHEDADRHGQRQPRVLGQRDQDGRDRAEVRADDRHDFEQPGDAPGSAPPRSTEREDTIPPSC
jgi:hypothetical protein